ncbi:MAG TPA: cupin domain-containing protein, partial [Terriglobales bacterium]|nr:cupin domain-containing protein [Terriglobales bacterium]
MSVSDIATEDARLEALHRRLAENSLGGHWQSREKTPPLKPFLWRWSVIYSCLMESGDVIKLGHDNEAANRRTVQLVNPMLSAQKSTSRSLQMSVQLVKPGERAECHRHTAAAIRFVVEGDGTGYTNVEGEQMFMESGDLVLTPNWTWHDHHNPAAAKQIVWLDVLDVPLARYLDALFHGGYGEGPAQPIIKPDGYCRQRLGTVRPRMAIREEQALPYTYKWHDTLQTLKGLAAAGRIDPCDGVFLEYANPLTGGPTMPTIGCWVQWLAPGEATRGHRHTSTTIYHVIQGEGATTVGDRSGVGDD